MNPFDQFDVPQAASGEGNPFDQFDAPAKAQKAPQDTSVGRTMLDQGMQGATFGFADEGMDRIGARIASLYTGEKYDDLLKEARGMSKQRMAAQMEERPALSIGSNIAGGLMTGVGTAVPKALTGAAATTGVRGAINAIPKAGAAIGDSLRTGNLAARLGKGAAAGAASGAAYGAGTADDGQRLEGAGQGAIYGGAFGAAIPAVGAAVKGTASGIADTARGIMARSPEAAQDAASVLKDKAGNLYNQMRNVGATYKPAAVNGFLLPEVDKAVNKHGFIPALNPKTVAIVDAMKAEAAQGNLGLDTLDQYRRQLGRIGATEDGVSAGAVRKVIDGFVNSTNASFLQNGSKNAVTLLNQGRKQYAQAAKFETVSEILLKADGDANKIKAGLTRLVQKIETNGNRGGFSKSEIAALKNAAKSSFPEKLLKMGGKFGIDLGSSFTPGNTVAPVIGGFINPAVPVAGTAARQAGKYIARGKAEQALRVLEGTAKPSIPGRAISPLLSAPAGGAAGAINAPRSPMPIPAPQVRMEPMGYTQPGEMSNTTSEPEQPGADMLKRFAQAESSGNPNARTKEPGQTASGLFGFNDPTWRLVVKKWGKETGIGLADKNNGNAQRVMAKKLADDNAQYLMANLDIQPTIGDMYTAHFMGAPQAVRLIKAQGSNEIASKVFPKEAAVNRKIFYEKLRDGSFRPRTVEEVYQLLQSKVS